MSALNPSVTQRRRLAPDERRGRLLEAGVKVFARRGLGGGAHAEIAREEGIAVSTTFVYFPTREALRDAVLEAVAQHLLGIGWRIHKQQKSALEVVSDHLHEIARSFREQPHYALVWLAWSTAYHSDVWPHYERHQAEALDRMAETLERGQREDSIRTDLDPMSTSRLLIGAATMLAEMVMKRRSAGELGRYLDTMLGAVRARPPRRRTTYVEPQLCEP